jgi:Helicase conserved C-terminal domain
VIVVTSALGTGVDIPGIVFVLHVDMPWGMIDFAQESGRAGRGGEVVDSIILVEENSVERRLRQNTLSLDASAMATFITTAHCRRRVMTDYLDGPDLTQSCADITGGARCDRCGEGLVELEASERQAAREWQLVKQALDDMAEGCALCWVLGGEGTDFMHSLAQCDRWLGVTEADLDEFRRQIVYQRNSHSCTRCGMSQKYCATGQDTSMPCQWPNVVVAVLRAPMGSAEGFSLIQRVGYQGSYQDWSGYTRWLGLRHEQRVWGDWMSNGMAVLIEVILYTLGY